LKDREWEAWIGGEKWSDGFRKVFPNDTVLVFPPDEKAQGSRKRASQEERKEIAWEWLAASQRFRDEDTWLSLTESDTDPSSTTVGLVFLGTQGESITRIPKGAEWAFVSQIANHKWGQGNWIASLRGERWFRTEESLKVKGLPLRGFKTELEERLEALRKGTQFSTKFQAPSLPPDPTGDVRVLLRMRKPRRPELYEYHMDSKQPTRLSQERSRLKEIEEPILKSAMLPSLETLFSDS
jgi:hypothetical protein